MADNTDHNDVAKKRGLSAVKKTVESAIDAAKGQVFTPFEIRAGGVYWQPGAKKDGEPQEAIFFCSLLRPIGLARSPKGQDFALMLEMRNPDGALIQFLLRLEDLHLGGGEAARIEFARRGGYYGPGIRARQLFADYINAIMRFCKNLPRLLLADRTGWLKSGAKYSFVLPDNSIGEAAEKIILQQTTSTDAPGFDVSGTAADSNQHLIRYCIGNSRLFLAVCAPLAGPLQHIMGKESGGLHIVGQSSEGKTSILWLAASVMGDPTGTVKTLDATANALEGAAALANDALLILDELGQADPAAIGQIVYKLASGIGRGRADQRGDARNRKSWRAPFLTSGETDIETMMRSAGKRPAAGQQLRLASIPAAPEGGHGIFEELHGFPSGAALSDHIRQSAGKYHGALFRAYLTHLVKDLNTDPDGLRDRLNSIIKSFVADVAPAGSDGQVIRVAGRFGLLAAAGEYAAQTGVLDWPAGDATWGVRECFLGWLQRRGGHGPLEIRNVLETFEGWLQSNGDSRFVPMDGDERKNNHPVNNRAGFRRLVTTVTGDESSYEYFIFPAAFREATQGQDSKWAAKILHQHGILAADKNGELCRQKKLPGIGNTRVYHVPARIGGATDNAEIF